MAPSNVGFDIHYKPIQPPCLLCPINSGLHETDENLLKEDLPDLPDILELFRACRFGLAIRHELSKLFEDIAKSQPIQSQAEHSFIIYIRGTPYKDTEMNATLLHRVKNLGARMLQLRNVLHKWKRARFDNAEVMNRMEAWSTKFTPEREVTVDGCIHEELRVMLAVRDIIIGFLHVVMANYPKTEDGFQADGCHQHQPPQPRNRHLQQYIRVRIGNYFVYSCDELFLWLQGTTLYSKNFQDAVLNSVHLHHQLYNFQQHPTPESRNAAEGCILQYDRWLIPLLAFWTPLKDLNIDFGKTKIWANAKIKSWGVIEGCVIETKGRYKPAMEQLNDLWARTKSSGALDEGRVDRALAELEFLGCKIELVEAGGLAAEGFVERLKQVPIDFPTTPQDENL